MTVPADVKKRSISVTIYGLLWVFTTLAYMASFTRRHWWDQCHI